MTPEVELRRAEPADAAAIRRLTRDAYARWVPVIGREPKPMGADYEAALQSHRFDLLYQDGVLAGLIETIDQGDRLLIENVAVAPALQGRGLGSMLMAHAEDIARSLGRDRLSLYTNQRFVENLRLYARLGYGIDGEEDLGGGTVRVDMSKAVPKASRGGGIEVGYARPEDLEPARLLLKSTAERLLERLEQLWPPHEFTPEWIAAKHEAGELVVGRADGKVVGCALVAPEDPDFWPDRPEGEALYMHRICAGPEGRGGRFTKAFFAWVEAEARRLRKPYLRLDCFPRPKLRAVYEGEGFEKVDDRWVHYLYVYRYERAVS